MSSILFTFRRASSWLGLALLLILLGGCRQVDPVIKIGFVAPFEGRYRPVGYDALYSARLAIREINAAGGLNGYRLELVVLDDGGDPALARQVAESLLIDPEVILVIGHWLPETNAVAGPLYAAGGLAFVPAGEPPLTSFAPELLPADFLSRYAGVTPFAETAGPYAGPAYDSLQLALAAISRATEATDPNRATIREALTRTTIEGLTGTIILPGGS